MAGALETEGEINHFEKHCRRFSIRRKILVFAKGWSVGLNKDATASLTAID